jgi:hypothetical protein
MSDFMIDVFVFKGEFDAATMANDPIYSAYFTSTGLIKSKLNEFANLRQVSLIAQYTGSILPGFKDLEGRNLYIESIINTEARRTGLFCAVDEDAVLDENGTKVDFIGHIADETQDFELLSHVVGQDVHVHHPIQLTGDETITVNGDTLVIDNITEVEANKAVEGEDSLLSAVANEYTLITNTLPWAETTPAVGLSPALGTITIECDANISTSYSSLSGTTGELEFLHVSNSRVTPYTFGDNYNGVLTAGLNGSTSFTVSYLTSAISNLNPAFSFPIVPGDYVDSATSGRLARVSRISKKIDPNNNLKTIFEVFTDITPDYSDRIIKSFENASAHYKTFVLPKAEITVKTISQYLSVLSGGIGLYEALVDKDMIDFRYIVDTFTSFDVNGLNNKRNLSQLAKDRQNASAILNAPTIEDFKKSFDPSFTDADGVFNTTYIATGGNQDKNPTKVYSLPSITEGANYAFYYGPGLIVSDNGKDIIVPAAAYVSNNYMDKYTNALPWSIVAGPRRGVVSGTNVKGTEYAFDKNDRDVLEPFGINPIVFQRGTGLTILGNKTAQQSIKSALSSAHVREALIYIQDGMADILKDYVFEFNNVQTRLEIKTLADSFLEGVKQDGGVYEFKNVMDQSNNTNEVIDNNMGIIDTYVEPVKGLEIVVHRTTILNTGEIQSGNLA